MKLDVGNEVTDSSIKTDQLLADLDQSDSNVHTQKSKRKAVIQARDNIKEFVKDIKRV